MARDEEAADTLGPFRQFLSLERDVLVLSVAMLAFSLGFQMTNQYFGLYLDALGASALVVGLYRSFSDLVGAVYPYAGGLVSDRIGSRTALTAFGLASSAGFLVWALAPDLAVFGLPAWAFLFLGLLLAQAWKSFGLGATFAIVKQSVPPERLASGFASTEVFRRVGFLLGPLLAAFVVERVTPFVEGFQAVLLLAVAFGLLATFAQHRLYDPAGDSFGKSFAGLRTIRDDLLGMPDPLRPLLLGDTLVRFANGMVYVFFSIVVAKRLGVGFEGFGVAISPAAFFGVLLGVEMTVALLTMVPVSKVAERVGLKPVVATGFLVYATFPILLILAPPDQWVLVALFAFSGLRFAGLPSHKALIVGPAEANAGGRVTGTYYLVRNTLVVPAGVLGGYLYGIDPVLSFGVASAVGLVGVGLFLAFGEEFAAVA
ncbi:MFS transporter [Salinirubellus salinus]|uniref:MFS transporter n=1 Tax=Salinirubellus salinus TaxID=1364945 RepID=A0A9E7U677_9EURY|nr:MFS transporter [Salinirubellus salinus]UWM56190.1 MFS transporter [Salinirubellus salinus]